MPPVKRPAAEPKPKRAAAKPKQAPQLPRVVVARLVRGHR